MENPNLESEMTILKEEQKLLDSLQELLNLAFYNEKLKYNYRHPQCILNAESFFEEWIEALSQPEVNSDNKEWMCKKEQWIQDAEKLIKMASEDADKADKKEYYWITTPYQALFKKLEIIPGEVCPKDTTEGLYYPCTDEGFDEAEGMLRKIKEAIYCYNSTSKFPQRWITKKWRDEITIKHKKI